MALDSIEVSVEAKIARDRAMTDVFVIMAREKKDERYMQLLIANQFEKHTKERLQVLRRSWVMMKVICMIVTVNSPLIKLH